MDLFAKLSEKLTKIYKKYETRIDSNNGIKHFVIINPFWEENIQICARDGIIFVFSFQHAHFDYCGDDDKNIDCLVEHINTFLEGKRVAIEFFQGETNLFGGDRYQDDIDMSSGESLLKSFVGDNQLLYESLYKQVKGVSCRCSIRGWDSTYNKDIDFVL